jgi:hypothetical protein
VLDWFGEMFTAGVAGDAGMTWREINEKMVKGEKRNGPAIRRLGLWQHRKPIGDPPVQVNEKRSFQ